MQFLSIPRNGEIVHLLLNVSYLDAVIAAGFTGQVRVQEVIHVPRRDSVGVVLELEPIYMPELGQAFVVLTYLAQEFLLSFEPSQGLMGEHKTTD